MKKILKVVFIVLVLFNARICKISQIAKEMPGAGLNKKYVKTPNQKDLPVKIEKINQNMENINIDESLPVTLLAAEEESPFDKNRKSIINNGSFSDGEKEYRIFQNTLIDQLAATIDFGDNDKCNLFLDLKDEYIEVKSGNQNGSFKFGLIYYKNYIGKCIDQNSKTINRKREFLNSIYYALKNDDKSSPNGLPDNIRLALLSRLNSLRKDENFIQHLYRISPTPATDIKSDVDYFAEAVASIVEASFCYREFSKTLSIVHGCSKSAMSGVVQQGGSLVVENAYLEIVEKNGSKTFHIQIADKLESSNSSDIKKTYIWNFIEKLDQSDVPQNYKQPIIEQIQNDMYDVLTLSSQNIEGKNIIEKIIEIAPKLILNIVTSLAIAAALTIVSSFLYYLYKGYQIGKSVVNTLQDFMSKQGFFNVVFSAVNLYLNFHSIKQMAADISSLNNVYGVNENSKDCAKLSSAIYENNFNSQAESLGFKVLATSGSEEAKLGVKSAILEKNGLKYIVSEGTNFSAPEGVAQLKADASIFIGKRAKETQSCFENWARTNMNKLGISQFDYATGHSLGGSHVITFSAETNFVKNTITFDSPQVAKSTTVNAQILGKNIMNFRASLVGYKGIDKDCLDITNVPVQVNSVPRILVAAIKEHSKGGVQAAWGLIEELNKHKMQEIARVIPKFLSYLE